MMSHDRFDLNTTNYYVRDLAISWMKDLAAEIETFAYYEPRWFEATQLANRIGTPKNLSHTFYLKPKHAYDGMARSRIIKRAIDYALLIARELDIDLAATIPRSQHSLRAVFGVAERRIAEVLPSMFETKLSVVRTANPNLNPKTN